ncbi:MAG TPA: 2-C-methyl-D-erythritol 4-phosphate cytidylyltransferase, partial [Porphyromonadaceae bacterium]|nr:2-C-methyl-D-erythritol 4-phosphate cytidylyltransferase [Porphyromonadaceae bacterium]
FDTRLLKSAYSEPCRDTFTDDASVVEACGRAISIFPGDVDNIKITSPSDFGTAEMLLNRRGK